MHGESDDPPSRHYGSDAAGMNNGPMEVDRSADHPLERAIKAALTTQPHACRGIAPEEVLRLTTENGAALRERVKNSSGDAHRGRTSSARAPTASRPPSRRAGKLGTNPSASDAHQGPENARPREELEEQFHYISEKLPDPTAVRANFRWIWLSLADALDIDCPPADALEVMKGTTIYDILDGTRSTMTADPFIDNKMDGGLFSLGLIRTLQGLDAKQCVLMVYTAYNRRRGKSETNLVLEKIFSVSPLVKHFFSAHNISCNIVMGRDIPAFRRKMEQLELDRNGDGFRAHFLFDYTEEWAMNGGKRKIASLPTIDVCVRHTKFQPYGGGYIPYRMRTASYVYSQNGSVLSNWNSIDFTTLAAVALLSNILNGGEALSKTFGGDREIIHRYRERELDLYHKRVRLGNSDTPKRFIIGCPTGTIEVVS